MTLQLAAAQMCNIVGTRMTTVTDVSSSLGEYMLRGWVLTDRICAKCSRVPLMRSPSSAAVESHLCVNCDLPAANGASRTLHRSPLIPHVSSASGSGTSNVSGLSVSRSSTPPTEVSNAPSSPVFAPVMDTAELLRRRHQSDHASAEIGRRMLQGWAMLADECPGPDCYGIPLVRPPKTGATIDPRKECVICGIVYVDEKDATDQDRLVPMQPSGDTHQVPEPVVAQTLSFPVINRGDARDNLGFLMEPEVPVLVHPRIPMEVRQTPNLSTSSALEASAQSLERSLLVLSEHLNRCAASPTIDMASIGQTADTITKVSQALNQVKQLLWSETRALGTLHPCAPHDHIISGC